MNLDSFDLDRAIDLRRNSDAHLFEPHPRALDVGGGFITPATALEGGGAAGIRGGANAAMGGANAAMGGANLASASTGLNQTEVRRMDALRMGQRGRRLVNGQRFRYFINIYI